MDISGMIWKSFSNYQFIRVENPELHNQLREIMKHADMRMLRKQICKKHSITQQTYNNQISGRTPITIPILNDILDIATFDKSKIVKQIISTSKFKSGVGGNSYSVKIPTELSKDLAYFVGAIRDGVLCSRGSEKGEYVLEIYQKNIRWLKETIKPIIKTLFDIEPIVDNKKMRVRIWSKVVYIFIKDIFEYRETRKEGWATPKVILESSQDIQKSYIQGFFDTEGWLTKNNRWIGIAQSWHENDRCPPLDDIKLILSSIGIKSTVRSVKIINPNWKPGYVLAVSNKAGIRNFILNIGSRHPDKAENIENFLRLSLP